MTTWQGRGRLDQLVTELDRQKATKMDVVVDTRRLVVKAEKNVPSLVGIGQASEFFDKPMPIRETAFDQLVGKCNPSVPPGFAKELMRSQGDLASNLLTELLHRTPERRFVRCLDSQVRAFLSNRYRVMDNMDIAFTTLDVVRENGGEVIEATLSDTHMRLKFTTRQVWDVVNAERKRDSRYGTIGNHTWLGRSGFNLNKDLPGGPGTVHPVVTISNSETGHGGLYVQTGILQAICVNMAIVSKDISHFHLGERVSEGVFSEETLSMDSKAIFLKARDVIREAFTPGHFKRMVEIANNAQGKAISAPDLAVQNLVKKEGLTDEDKNSILAYFVKDYDLTQYGLAQAVARRSQDFEEGEKIHQLEELAGRVMTGVA